MPPRGCLLLSCTRPPRAQPVVPESATLGILNTSCIYRASSRNQRRGVSGVSAGTRASRSTARGGMAGSAMMVRRAPDRATHSQKPPAVPLTPPACADMLRTHAWCLAHIPEAGSTQEPVPVHATYAATPSQRSDANHACIQVRQTDIRRMSDVRRRGRSRGREIDSAQGEEGGRE